MLLLASLLVCEVALPPIVILPSQQARQIALTRPTLEIDADFTQIKGIRELSDGRFLLTDRVEQRLVLGDPRTGRLTGIGRVGSGRRPHGWVCRLAGRPSGYRRLQAGGLPSQRSCRRARAGGGIA